MFELIEIHKELKLFVKKKSFIRKTISNYQLLFLEELIWRKQDFKNTIMLLFN
jgi:hypothetical protein